MPAIEISNFVQAAFSFRSDGAPDPTPAVPQFLGGAGVIPSTLRWVGLGVFEVDLVEGYDQALPAYPAPGRRNVVTIGSSAGDLSPAQLCSVRLIEGDTPGRFDRLQICCFEGQGPVPGGGVTLNNPNPAFPVSVLVLRLPSNG